MPDIVFHPEGSAMPPVTAHPEAQGVQGIQGIQGPQGPPGGGGSGSMYYAHHQTSPLTVWTITHNLGAKPNVSVVDSADSQVEGDVQYVDNNSLTLTFTGAFSGWAYLS